MQPWGGVGYDCVVGNVKGMATHALGQLCTAKLTLLSKLEGVGFGA